MLKLTKHTLIRLLLCLAFSMVIFTPPALADEITIDLDGLGKTMTDIAERELTVWQVSDRILEKDKREDLAKSLEGEDLDRLNARYRSISCTTDAVGRVSRDFARGTYYVRVSDKTGAIKIYPFVFVTNTEEKRVYPKWHRDVPPGDVDLLKVSNDDIPLAGAVFKLYRLNGHTLTAIKSSEKSTEFVTDAKGKIYKDKLIPGDYLFEEIRAPGTYRIKNAKTYFTVTSNKTTYVRVVNYKEEEGGKRFKKISSDKGTPLAGAKFVVTKKTADGYERIKQKGKDVVLTSGDDGYLMADNLPYGEYFLWETQAPKGYISLSGPIRFEIDAKSLKEDITIKNKPAENTPPPKTTPPGTPYTPPSGGFPPSKHLVIPKTGDISLLLLALAGVMCALVGRRLLKDNKEG